MSVTKADAVQRKRCAIYWTCMVQSLITGIQS